LAIPMGMLGRSSRNRKFLDLLSVVLGIKLFYRL
jgi:hypothetical protein